MIKWYTLKKCNLKYVDGALSGCTKTESLRTRLYVLSKAKILKDYQRSLLLLCFMFYFKLFVKNCLKTVGELLHLLTVYSK